MGDRIIIGHKTQTGRVRSGAGSALAEQQVQLNAMASANEPGANKLVMGWVAKDEMANRQ